MGKRLFAASGSCMNPTKQINGKVNGITFTSSEFTGTMDSQVFWDRLREFATSQSAYIELVY